MMKPRKQLACDFIAYLKTRRVKAVNLEQPNEWLSGAIATTCGSGNPSGSTLKLSKAAEQRLARAFEELVVSLRDESIAGQTTFDKIFFEVVTQVERGANPQDDTSLFTFGRAQKFVTISLKYCYAWWFCKQSPSPKYGDLSWVERWAACFHVPVDNFTLKHLQNGAHKHVALSGSLIISWKWHLSKSRYCRIQDAIRDLANTSGFVDPLHYEMDQIWTRSEEDSE